MFSHTDDQSWLQKVISCFRSKEREPGKRLLIKGEPGMGKTILVKVAWDWATRLLKLFL